ncbi:hypothetical protein T02_1303 [Trichinella nativa]|uniref:Uncharacterized protein n=1 Tax=Trichinella nativa TaxID=6335 RepID=A0A0V1KVN3_9BILA|nr:hypothetical protein T02_1303 [Trichinella nativa]
MKISFGMRQNSNNVQKEKGAVGWDLSWKITMMRDLMESKNYNTASIISQAAHSILVISIIFDKSLLRYY